MDIPAGSRLPERRAAVADLLFSQMFAAGVGALVREASSGEFVRVPGLVPSVGVEPLALGGDGQTVLVRGREGGRLGLHRLESGDTRWFDVPVEGTDHLGAVSPDGSRMAALNIDHAADGEPAVRIHEVDVVSGERRELWSAPGGWSDESVVSWSPDGRLVAVTYLAADDWATAVVDAGTGSLLVHDGEGWATLGSSNGTWTEDGRLVRYDPDWFVTYTRIGGPGEVEVETTNVTMGSIPFALLGDRFVVDAKKPLPPGLATRNLEGGDPRPFVTMEIEGSANGIDVARA